MNHTKTTSDRESERRYQHQFEASRRAEQRAMHLLDFVPNPMVIFKLDGRVNYVNPAFSEMFGWTLDELAGKHIPYVPPDLVEEAVKDIKTQPGAKLSSDSKPKG
jgi:PAS domain S-box-containing protein